MYHFMTHVNKAFVSLEAKKIKNYLIVGRLKKTKMLGIV